MKESFKFESTESDPYENIESELESRKTLEDEMASVRGRVITALVLEGFKEEKQKQKDVSMDNYFSDWSYKYYSRVEKIFDDMVHEDPNTLMDWQDEHKQQRILDKVKERLFDTGEEEDRRAPRLVA